MASKVVIEPRKDNGHYSKFVRAVKEIANQIPAEPEGMYDHTVKIKSGDVSINSDTLDCEFDIPFDDDAEANEGEIIVYNLTDKTIRQIKKGNKISVTAGYGKDTGVIFSGTVSKVLTRYEGLDKVTTITVVDGNGRKDHEVKEIAFAAGTKASTILKNLIGKTGISIAVFKIKRDHTFKDKTTVDGSLMEGIKKYAQICGVSAYVCKSKIYVCPLTYGQNTNFVLSAETGLLSISEFEEEQTAEEYKDVVRGYEIEMLLQHRIQTASVVRVKSKNVNGTFRVREGTHTYDGENFITKVKAISAVVSSKSDK